MDIVEFRKIFFGKLDTKSKKNIERKSFTKSVIKEYFDDAYFQSQEKLTKE